MQLVVLDDDQAVAEFLASVGVSSGWAVHAVIREDEFQALVSASPPDAIMLDLQLANSDGVEQLQFLHDCHYAGAIVLMSGFDARVLSSAQQIGGSLGLNIVAALEKPARPVSVREVLAQIARLPRSGVAAPAYARPPTAVISADEVTQAMSAGRMELHLQPIIAAASHAVKRAEALIRWRDPARGLVGPDQFIPVAEQDIAIIDRLTMWVAETGVSHYRRLAEMGSGIQICINISGQNLRAQDFPDRMAGLLERHAVPEGALALEITESVAMHDLDATASVLTRLPEGLPGGDRRFRHRAFVADCAAADAVLRSQDRQVLRERTGDVEGFADNSAIGHTAGARHGTGKRRRRRWHGRCGAAVDRTRDRWPAGLLL